MALPKSRTQAPPPLLFGSCVDGEMPAFSKERFVLEGSVRISTSFQNFQNPWSRQDDEKGGGNGQREWHTRNGEENATDLHSIEASHFGHLFGRPLGKVEHLGISEGAGRGGVR